VDEHDERVFADLRQRRPHGFCPRYAARDDGDDLGGDELLREQNRRLLPARRSCDDDRVDPVRAVEPREALREQRTAAERSERLRAISTQATACAGCDEERPDVRAGGGT
jgi:hypothetical protein